MPNSYRFSLRTAIVFAATLLAFCISRDAYCGDFVPHDLVRRVVDWYPVDLDGDGVWELVAISEPPPQRIGVYDLAAQAWIDGPRSLPGMTTLADLVAAVDHNDDGFVEYIYAIGSDIHNFDTKTGVDQYRWSAQFAPEGLIAWGQSENGEEWIALKRSFLESPGTINAWQRFAWQIQADSSGEYETTIMGDAGDGWFLPDYPNAGDMALVFHEAQAKSKSDGPGIATDYWQNLHFIDTDWSTIKTLELPGIDDVAGAVVAHAVWEMEAAAIVPQATGQPVSLVSFTESFQWDDDLGCFNISDSVLNSLANGTLAYSGCAVYDITGDSDVEIILPLSSGDGWELRDPVTGVVQDTMEGMPLVDLRSGPLKSPAVNELFFFRTDTLFVWEPLAVGILDDNSDVRRTPLSVELYASPNPFNSSVRISLQPAGRLESIDIYDVLGRRVRTLALVKSSSQVLWDARDDNGHPLPSGMYFARGGNGVRSTVSKLILLR